MADTASYAGAMKTQTPPQRAHGATRIPSRTKTRGAYPGKPDTGSYVAKAKGDARPGSLQADMPLGVHRSAAQKRLGRKFKSSQGAGSRKIPPKNQYT